MSFMNKELSDDLLPFSGKLSERFYEVRENVAGFCAEIENDTAPPACPPRRPTRTAKYDCVHNLDSGGPPRRARRAG